MNTIHRKTQQTNNSQNKEEMNDGSQSQKKSINAKPDK